MVTNPLSCPDRGECDSEADPLESHNQGYEQYGTISLRGTKGRRDDVMPLPISTGHTIVEYLRHERPKTKHRMVFARHIAPREQTMATFSSTAFFPAGVYDLFFDIAGSQRGDINLTTLFFGNQIIPYTLASGAGFTTQSVLGVNVVSPSRVVFDNSTSADNFGNLLDNVRLERRESNSVPEPSTLLLLASALFGLGAARRWRRV